MANEVAYNVLAEVAGSSPAGTQCTPLWPELGSYVHATRESAACFFCYSKSIFRAVTCCRALAAPRSSDHDSTRYGEVDVLGICVVP